MVSLTSVAAVVSGWVLFTATGIRAQGAPPSTAFDVPQRVLHDAVRRGAVGSAVGLIARGGNILFLEAVGDISPGEPMPVNAIARLASIQKPLTAAAVLTLVEAGQLSLADTVGKWFAGFGTRVLGPGGDTVAAARGVTVFDLLTHQAGQIAQGPELEALWESASNQVFAQRIGAIPLRFQPGTRFEYGCCGAAYEVLAAIAERVTGRSFKYFLTTTILQPLGMADTYFIVPPAKLPRLAAHYGRAREGGLVLRRARGQEDAETAFYSGGGGLRSTVLDYHRGALMLLNGGTLDGVRILRAETVAQMTTNQVGDRYPGDGFGWGLGMQIQMDSTGRPGGAGSFSWNGGTGTRFEVDPESGAIIVFFAPSWPGTPGIREVRNAFVEEAILAVRRLGSRGQ